MFTFLLLGFLPAIWLAQRVQGIPILGDPDYYKWSDGTYRTRPEPQKELTREEWKAILKDEYHKYFK